MNIEKPRCTGLICIREAGRGGQLRHTHVCGLEVGHEGKCFCKRCQKPFTCYEWKPRPRKSPVEVPENG
jgi:hypothetical protein